MTDDDIRWQQRLVNFNKAMRQLKDAVELVEKRDLSPLEEQGMVQAFEYTHELAWKTLKDFLENRGVKELYGSKDVCREAFRAGLLNDGEIWMSMIKSRNETSHTYNEDTAAEIVRDIKEVYFREFVTLQELLNKLREKENHK